MLTEIPFIRLRDGLPTALLQGRASFAETVAEAQEALAPPTLVLDIARLSMICGGRVVRLPPIEFALVLWLARRRLRGESDRGALSWRDADSAEFLATYRALPGACRNAERVARGLRGGIDKAWFEQRVARVNKLVRDALGTRAGPYLITATGRRPNTRHGLVLAAGDLEITAPAAAGD